MVKGTKARLKNNKDQGKFESLKYHSALTTNSKQQKYFF